VITQRGGKRDLFFGGKARGLNVGCAEFLQQLARKALDDGMPVCFRGLGDVASVDQPRLSMPRKPERTRTPLFRAERGRILVPEYKGAGNSPFAGTAARSTINGAPDGDPHGRATARSLDASPVIWYLTSRARTENRMRRAMLILPR